MSKQAIYEVRVEFGDCDPAGIVWFPNFFRWIDAASRHFFVSCGVPPWHALEKSIGVFGTPIVDTKAKFINTTSYGDRLNVEVTVKEWRTKSFVQAYRILRGDTVIMECEEVRIFAARREDGQPGVRAVAIPAEIRSLCE